MPTDSAGALADTSKLSPFDGRAVLRTTIIVTGAGDGLSEAMKIDPTELHHGGRVYAVLECDVAKVRFDQITDTDALTRVHILKAGTAVMVERDLVGKAIDEQRRRNETAKEAAAGVGRLPFDDEATRAHEDGLHASGLVPGCPRCDGEAAEVAAIAAEPPTAPTPIAGRAKRARKATKKP